eukprot:m51a1_g450 putative f y-rich n-terminus family protein (694) ;mRNA; f:130228-136272
MVALSLIAVTAVISDALGAHRNSLRVAERAFVAVGAVCTGTSSTVEHKQLDKLALEVLGTVETQAWQGKGSIGVMHTACRAIAQLLLAARVRLGESDAQRAVVLCVETLKAGLARKEGADLRALDSACWALGALFGSNDDGSGRSCGCGVCPAALLAMRATGGVEAVAGALRAGMTASHVDVSAMRACDVLWGLSAVHDDAILSRVAQQGAVSAVHSLLARTISDAAAVPEGRHYSEHGTHEIHSAASMLSNIVIHGRAADKRTVLAEGFFVELLYRCAHYLDVSAAQLACTAIADVASEPGLGLGPHHLWLGVRVVVTVLSEFLGAHGAVEKALGALLALATSQHSTGGCDRDDTRKLMSELCDPQLSGLVGAANDVHLHYEALSRDAVAETEASGRSAEAMYMPDAELPDLVAKAESSGYAGEAPRQTDDAEMNQDVVAETEGSSHAVEAMHMPDAELALNPDLVTQAVDSVCSLPNVDPATGATALPLVLDESVTVTSLGKVVDWPYFHTERYLWPLGYSAVRQYPSCRDPPALAHYDCMIGAKTNIEGTQEPEFRVTLRGSPATFVAPTPGLAVSQMFRQLSSLCILRGITVPQSKTGPDFFGLGHPVVIAVLQQHPGARRCSKYVFKRVEHGTTTTTGQQGLAERSVAFGAGAPRAGAVDAVKAGLLARDLGALNSGCWVLGAGRALR